VTSSNVHRSGLLSVGARTSSGCTYERKFHSKHRPAGTKCQGTHSTADCYAQKDDLWLTQHPGKTSADLPSWASQQGSNSPTWRRGQSPNRFHGHRSQRPSSPKPRVRFHEETAEQAGLCYQGFHVPDGLDQLHAGVSELSLEQSTDDSEDTFEKFYCAYTGIIPDSTSTATPSVQTQLNSKVSSVSTHTLILDSGANTTYVNFGTDLQLLSSPAKVTTAGNAFIMAYHTASIPCPALGPGRTIRGIYSPHFTHNLLAVGDLQAAGILIQFSSKTASAICHDGRTGQITCIFARSKNNLFEYTLQEQQPLTASRPQADLQGVEVASSEGVQAEVTQEEEVPVAVSPAEGVQHEVQPGASSTSGRTSGVAMALVLHEGDPADIFSDYQQALFGSDAEFIEEGKELSDGISEARESVWLKHTSEEQQCADILIKALLKMMLSKMLQLLEEQM